MNVLSTSTYVTSLDEVFCGVILIALTMAMHGVGVILTLRAGVALQRRHVGHISFFWGISTLIIATWILVSVHLIEVLMWGVFYWLRDAFPNGSTAVYYALGQYTTVGSEFSLPDRLRLLGGMNAMAGLLTFAWSTSVLFMLAQKFQSQQLTAVPDERSGAVAAAKRDNQPGAG